MTSLQRMTSFADRTYDIYYLIQSTGYPLHSTYYYRVGNLIFGCWCQRYLCSKVIPMIMNVFIFRNLSLKTVFIEPYVKINYSLSLSLSFIVIVIVYRYRYRYRLSLLLPSYIVLTTDYSLQGTH